MTNQKKQLIAFAIQLLILTLSALAICYVMKG